MKSSKKAVHMILLGYYILVGASDGYHIILFFVFFCGNFNRILSDSGQAAVAAAAGVQRGILPDDRQRPADLISNSVGDGLLSGNPAACRDTRRGAAQAQVDSDSDDSGEHRYSGGAQVCQLRHLYD